MLHCVGRLAVCGETGTLNFNFPFTEFLPAEQKITFSAEVRVGGASLKGVWLTPYSVGPEFSSSTLRPTFIDYKGEHIYSVTDQ